jgi:hypothetical protein
MAQRTAYSSAPNVPSEPRVAGSLRYDLVAAALCTWFIVGIFTDGWAHNHISRLETFFTPWHAVLYSGYLVNAVFLLATVVLNHRRSFSWMRALAPGYGVPLVGVGVFAVAGALDLTWHLINGIEQSIQALFSPTHLLLATGAFLILLGPVRSAWQRVPYASASLGALIPAVLSLAYCALLLLFFTQSAHPIIKSMADVGADYFPIALGAASVILQTVILMAVVLLAVRRWRLPFGSLTLLFALNYLGSAILANHVNLLAITVIGGAVGLIADVLVVVLRPSAGNHVGLRIFALLVPLVQNGVYFAVLGATKGVAWPINVWSGTIVMAAVASLLISFVLLPPTIPAAQDEG